MTGYKLNLKDYPIKKAVLKKCHRCGAELNDIDKIEEPYEIKEMIANIMCHPSLKHKGFRFSTVYAVAEKIAKCEKDHIVLDKADYDIVKDSFDEFVGYARNDGEMVSRIYNPEQVQLAPVDGKGKSGK